MGYLTTFRGLFGNVLEAFHCAKGLQPKDLLQALQATIEERKKLLLDGVYVPNRFTVHISRKDMGEIRPLLVPLIEQLGLKVIEWVAEKGYSTLSGNVRVAVVESAELAEDEVYIEAVMEEHAPGAARFGAMSATTSAVPAPGSAAPAEVTPVRTAPPRERRTVVDSNRRTIVMDRPAGHLRIVAGSGVGRSIAIPLGETTIGRGLGAGIVLEDEAPFVSRAHCVVRATPDRVTVVDLASTNGLMVNGIKVKEATLRQQDSLHVGVSSPVPCGEHSVGAGARGRAVGAVTGERAHAPHVPSARILGWPW